MTIESGGRKLGLHLEVVAGPAFQLKGQHVHPRKQILVCLYFIAFFFFFLGYINYILLFG